MNPEKFDNFVLENYGGVIRDSPWEKEPDFTVFRHGDNKKWFALRFYASKEQLLRLKEDDGVVNGYEEGAKIDIINLKLDPDLVEVVLEKPGILPAYHMHKRYWVTILLDGSVGIEEIAPLVDMSYELTMKKMKGKKR